MENSELMTEQSLLTLEQTKQELGNPSEEVEAAYEDEAQKWLNIKQKDVWKEHDHAPGKGPDILASKYKVQESLKMDGISIFSVNDSNIKADLDKEWKISGSYIDKDYISENEIWLSQDLSDVMWAEKLKEELVKLDENMDAPGGKNTPLDQLMFPEHIKKKEGD